MQSGVITFVHPERAYAFAKPADGSADVFLHPKGLQRAGITNLQRGQKVAFNVIKFRTKPGKFEGTDIKLLPMPHRRLQRARPESARAAIYCMVATHTAATSRRPSGPLGAALMVTGGRQWVRSALP